MDRSVRQRVGMTERRIAIKEGYANNESPKVIATRLNCSVASVKATASQLGITRTPKAAADFRRGFAVPAEMLVLYKKLMANNFSAKESGKLLGLVPQGEISDREFLDCRQEAKGLRPISSATRDSAGAAAG
ncbi:hypothetical protein [Mesorhizobium sangaii]|uniref:Uncharacterized protein n=1 Tax=Mesorhizobium sangaii TaxID=505389 RepID=A0A841P835_9HYPH|nr:hypothetical protein [Mesorhizobium sangaii]MBB6411306.1 hypothetical protein [Mesorhizobium sangaii]